jgi:hypothetical protein
MGGVQIAHALACSTTLREHTKYEVECMCTDGVYVCQMKTGSPSGTLVGTCIQTLFISGTDNGRADYWLITDYIVPCSVYISR